LPPLPAFAGFGVGDNRSTVTFSGTGLLAAGQGGGPGDKLLKVNQEQKRSLENIDKNIKKVADREAILMTA
jgi:hypothetical protein